MDSIRHKCNSEKENSVIDIINVTEVSPRVPNSSPLTKKMIVDDCKHNEHWINHTGHLNKQNHVGIELFHDHPSLTSLITLNPKWQVAGKNDDVAEPISPVLCHNSSSLHFSHFLSDSWVIWSLSLRNLLSVKFLLSSLFLSSGKLNTSSLSHRLWCWNSRSSRSCHRFFWIVSTYNFDRALSFKLTKCILFLGIFISFSVGISCLAFRWIRTNLRLIGFLS